MTALAHGIAPPGPPGRVLLGNLSEVRTDPLGFLAGNARRHGDVVRYRVLRTPVTLLARPDLIEGLLSSTGGDLRKGRLFEAVRPVVGNGLLLSEGAEWRRQRSVVQAGFSRTRLAAYGETMGILAETAVAGWRDGEARQIHDHLQRLTLAIAARTLLGVNIGSRGDDVGRAIGVFLERFAASARTGMLVPHGIPTPGNLRLRRAVARLDTVVEGLIAERRRQGREDDLLGTLLTSEDETGRLLSDREVRDQATTMLLAGHATTDVALTWALVLLGSHPGAQARLRDEVDALPADRPLSGRDLPQLRYASRVLHEALRLYPPVWALSRVAVRPRDADGYDIPAGSSVVVSQWVTHRDARYWDDPDAFVPERWDDRSTGRVPRHAYFPFGGGPRTCIGQAFALVEGTLILATIARHFTWTIPPETDIRPWPTFTLQPPVGLRIRLRARCPDAPGRTVTSRDPI